MRTILKKLGWTERKWQEFCAWQDDWFTSEHGFDSGEWLDSDNFENHKSCACRLNKQLCACGHSEERHPNYSSDEGLRSVLLEGFGPCRGTRDDPDCGCSIFRKSERL